MATLKPGDNLVLSKSGSLKEDIVIKYETLKKAVLVLRALNHKLRQRMVLLLEEHSRLTVTEIYVKLRLEQSVASQHLAILRKANIMKTERQGKYIYYSLNKERISEIAELVEDLAA